MHGEMQCLKGPLFPQNAGIQGQPDVAHLQDIFINILGHT